MNKDLDDRLIPNGEYRDAQNISVGKSEDDDIGALENILGNSVLDGTGNWYGTNNLKIIGYYSDDNSSTIYYFLTDYTDPNPLNPTSASSAANCFIYKYNNNAYTRLVEGSFLNFSTTDFISGINLVENLLFWTDNRNQPRKINVSKTLGYYTKEQQISVAKYNPYEPLEVMKKVEVTGATSTGTTLTLAQTNANILKGMLVVSKLGANGQAGITADEYLYVTQINGASAFGSLVGGTGYVNATGVATTVLPTGGSGLTVDITTVAGAVTVVAIANAGNGYNIGDVITITGGGGDATITLTAVNAITLCAAPAVAVLVADIVIFVETTMTGENISPFFNGVEMPGTPNWPGDPDYLEDKFVRFSYRFKFDDGEYSLMAPFSQPTFIPNQKGYFLGSGGAGPATPTDENDAYISTIIEFMDNGVQNVELEIPLPDIISNLGDDVGDSYKITHIDILYKESDQKVVKVIDSVNIDIQAGTTNLYTYNYRSSKPYKTLTERQTIRVYDKVPVRAFTQEVAGNRVMYGNYQSQHTPPETIDYQVGANEKSAPTTGEAVTEFYNWVEYPNHTLKQNRNYQVGFILADKFGRQSSVILSSNDTFTSSGNINYGGSTIYHPYNSSVTDLKKWFGDALKVLVSGDGITSDKDQLAGTPGLYALPEGNGFNMSALANINTAMTIPVLNVPGYEYEFTVTGGVTDVPAVGEYLRGEYKDFVAVAEVDATSTPVYKVYTEEPINDFLYSTNLLNTPDTKFAFSLPNTLGWYSYKLVVKQQEQDYYNVYLPGIVKGYPDQTAVSPKIDFPTTPTGSYISNIVLINDNINKIPRDLSEVGPEQKQFRSSVQLFGRVENNSATTNIQYFPGILSDTAITIAAATDANMAYELFQDSQSNARELYSTLSTTGQASMYQLDSNPLIARLSTSGDIGTASDATVASMVPYLAVYETDPVESALQLFYESSTSGLIADLNADVATGFDGVSGFSSLTLTLTEASDPAVSNGDISNQFWAQNNQGGTIVNTDIDTDSIGGSEGYPILSAVDGDGTNVTAKFTIVQDGTGYKFRVQANDFVYGSDGATQGVYTITLTWLTTDGDQSTTTTTIPLGNIVPVFVAGGSLPDVSVNPSDTAVVTRNGYNGSASNSTDALYYSITAGNGGGYFTMNPTTGAITQIANTTPLGVYNLTLRLDDAYNVTPQTGSLNVSKTQKITVGPTPVNAGVKSTCKNLGSPNNAATNQITAIKDQGAFIGAWYLSDSTLTSVDLPVTPSATYSSGGNDSDYLFKLGSALSQGTLVLSGNVQQQYSDNDGGLLAFTGSGIIWKVWYRDPDGANTWNQIDDVNNDNMGAPGVSVSLTNSSFGTNDWAQTVFAFDQVGEYCIAGIDATTNTAAVDADAMCAWVNSNDLYYSDCVVENGAVVTDGGSPKRYQYDLSTAQSVYNCVAVATTKYAPMPYANYVDLFYDDANLTTPFTPSSSEYYAFTTDPTEPFDSIKISAKFNTSGIKISPALGGLDPCNDMYARACQASVITCAHPSPGDDNW